MGLHRHETVTIRIRIGTVLASLTCIQCDVGCALLFVLLLHQNEFEFLILLFEHNEYRSGQSVLCNCRRIGYNQKDTQIEKTTYTKMSDKL